MPFPEEMRELAEAIVASKRDRREALASLKKEVKGQLAGYESDRQVMAEELHASLKADTAALMADSAALMKELGELDAARQAEVRSQKAEVKSQLAAYRSEREAMAEEVRAELAKTTKALKREARNQLRGYGGEMKELRAELVAGRRAWQQGLKGAPPKPKPRAQKKAPAKATRPKKPTE